MKGTHQQIDLRGVPCPRNTAKALMFLAGLDSDTLALIIIDDGEPVNNFLESLELENEYVLKDKKQMDNYWHLSVLKIE